MPTPSPESSMFLPSSPPQHDKDDENTVAANDGPAEEVEHLLAQAQTVTRLDPALEITSSSMVNSFFDVFERQVQLIKSRSQAFEDCHVTVYDKVLLALTQNGSDLDNVAAVTYFCEEYFGINVKNGNPEHNARVLSDAVNVPISFVQALSPPPTARESFSSSAEAKKPLFPTSSDRSQSASLAVIVAEADPSLSRLWTVYENAKNDYIAVADLNNDQTANCARFLRDTAENILTSLRGIENINERVLTELENTYNMSKHMAVALTGGKKRKFDDSDHNTEAKYVGRGYRRHTHARPQHHRNAISQTDFAGHSRAIADYRHRREYKNEEQGDQMRIRGTAEDRPKAKKPHKGRGPSGIPFGYTRPVDSYHPYGYP